MFDFIQFIQKHPNVTIEQTEELLKKYQQARLKIAAKTVLGEDKDADFSLQILEDVIVAALGYFRTPKDQLFAQTLKLAYEAMGIDVNIIKVDRFGHVDANYPNGMPLQGQKELAWSAAYAWSHFVMLNDFPKQKKFDAAMWTYQKQKNAILQANPNVSIDGNDVDSLRLKRDLIALSKKLFEDMTDLGFPGLDKQIKIRENKIKKLNNQLQLYEKSKVVAGRQMRTDLRHSFGDNNR
jgi:hypothetical protein